LLPAVLADAPPLPGEEARYAEVMAVIAAAKNDPKLKEVMTKAAAEADTELVTPLFQFRNYGQQLPYHWSTISNEADFGTDYFTRTAVAKSNIFVNSPNETKYFYQDLDATGARLSGQKPLHPDLSGGPDPACKRVLVFNALQRASLLRIECDQTFLRRHEEQDAEIQFGRFAHYLRARRSSGGGQADKLATGAPWQRLLALCPCLLA
jgi:hypothetical protein